MNKLINTLLLVVLLMGLTECKYGNIVHGPLHDLAKELCTEVTGDPEYHHSFLESFQNTRECIDRTFNSSAIHIETTELKPLGRMNELYNKTCAKQAAYIQCFTNESEVYDKCLTQQEVNDKLILKRVGEQVLNYICGTDGETVALFVEKSGPECFDEYVTELRNCTLNTFGNYETRNPFLPSSFVNSGTCGDFKNYQNCLIPILEQCSEQTITNLFKGLIETIKNELNCESA